MEPEIIKYHFADPGNGNIHEFASRVFDSDAILCFDLVDYSKDKKCSTTVRNQHLIKVKQSVQTILRSYLKPKIGIRISDFGSNDYYDDLEFLSTMDKRIKFDCLFLPKIINGFDLIDFHKDLEKRNIRFSEIIPIIGSKKAFNNFKTIISTSQKIVRKVAFSHCDFNFDLGNFPFYHQDSEEYWEWVNFLVKIAGQENIIYINSPYLYLYDEITFLKILNRLSQKTNCRFGQITFSLNQVRLCSLYESIPQVGTTYSERNESRHDIEETAKSIIKEYEENVMYGRSFSINNKRIIISSQEYLAAKKYLVTGMSDWVKQLNS